MPQPKGKTGNPAGKPVGTKNKITKSVRETLQAIFDGIAPEIPEYLQYMNRVDKLNFVCKILPYICPKMESVSEIEKDDKVIYINRTIVAGGGMGEQYGGITPEDFAKHALSTTVPIQSPNLTLPHEGIGNNSTDFSKPQDL